MNKDADDLIQAWIEGRIQEDEAQALLEAFEAHRGVLREAARQYAVAEMLDVHSEKDSFVERIMSSLESLSEHDRLQALEARTMRRISKAGGRARTFRRWAGWLAAAAMIAAGVSLLCYLPNDAPERIATITQAEGTTLAHKEGAPVPAQIGIGVSTGDRLRTGASGRADLRYGDGATISLSPETEIQLEGNLHARRPRLVRGSIKCEVPPQQGNLSFGVRAPHAEIVVVGTSFTVSADPEGSQVHVASGTVQVIGKGIPTELRAGGRCTADETGIVRWELVHEYDFAAARHLPQELVASWADAATLHTPARTVIVDPNCAQLTKEGLVLLTGPIGAVGHRLSVVRGTRDLGEDMVVEADIRASGEWSLQLAVSGDSFCGYRAIFSSESKNPDGVRLDSIWPDAEVVLARGIPTLPVRPSYRLRVEKRGEHISIWVDDVLALSARITYRLPADRLKTFALSSFGGAPVVRSVRVWKRQAP